jgi:hypothetical protein
MNFDEWFVTKNGYINPLGIIGLGFVVIVVGAGLNGILSTQFHMHGPLTPLRIWLIVGVTGTAGAIVLVMATNVLFYFTSGKGHRSLNL